MIEPWQRQIILEVATEYGVDPDLLAALRLTENGRKGREFGVLHPGAMIGDDPQVTPAASFRTQAQWAAGTISKNAQRYQKAYEKPAFRYTEDFVRFFSERYAPVGAGNAPTNLNAHHTRNLLEHYAREMGSA